MCSAEYFFQFILVVTGFSGYDQSSLIRVARISFTTALGAQGNMVDDVCILYLWFT